MRESKFHCPGCSCKVEDYESLDVVMVPVSAQLMHYLTMGRYTEPVRIKIERAEGIWEMTLHRPVVTRRHDIFFGRAKVD